MRFDGKTAIITGAGGGLGKAYAKALCQEGARVIIAEYNDQLGKAAEKELKDQGGSVVFIHTDVSKEEDIKNTVQKTIEMFGKIDILINNAQ